MCFNSKMQCAQILRLQTGVPTDTIARRIRVNRVGRDDGVHCFCSFQVNPLFQCITSTLKFPAPTCMVANCWIASTYILRS